MKEYTIQIGEVFTEEKAKELIEYLEMKEKDALMTRETTLKDILAYMDLRGWVYREEFIKKLK